MTNPSLAYNTIAKLLNTKGRNLTLSGAKLSTKFNSKEDVPLGRSGSGSVIQDHSDHGTSKKPMNP